VLITGPQGFESEAPQRIARSGAPRRMPAASRKRWAALRNAGVASAATPVPAKAARKKRRLSAERRARIVAATKGRWAAVRKAKAS
jgi:hypothetical protein